MFCCINHFKFCWIAVIFFFFFWFLLIHYVNNLSLTCHLQILSALHFSTPFLFHDDTAHHCIESFGTGFHAHTKLAAEKLPVFAYTSLWLLKSFQFHMHPRLSAEKLGYRFSLWPHSGCWKATSFTCTFYWMLKSFRFTNCTHTGWQLISYWFSRTPQAGCWKATSFRLHLTLAAEKLPVSHAL